MPQQNNSEVARLVAQITAEYESAENALRGMAAGTARHDFINARIDRVGALREELVETVGDREAMAVICRMLEEEER